MGRGEVTAETPVGTMPVSWAGEQGADGALAAAQLTVLLYRPGYTSIHLLPGDAKMRQEIDGPQAEPLESVPWGQIL